MPSGNFTVTVSVVLELASVWMLNVYDDEEFRFV
jgi:hypothetical protein